MHLRQLNIRLGTGSVPDAHLIHPSLELGMEHRRLAHAGDRRLNDTIRILIGRTHHDRS